MVGKDLRSAGIKATLPRLQVLEVFNRHPDRHLSAAEVYRTLAAERTPLGLATVYRVLGQLAQASVLSRLQLDPHGSLFELAGKGRHDHLVCTRCGRVVESADPAIARQAARVARRHGFVLETYNLGLYGRCRTCSALVSGPKGVFE